MMQRKDNQMKKFLRAGTALLLCLAMIPTLAGCLGSEPAPERAIVAENRMWGDLLYTSYSDGTAELTGYNGIATELILPAEVDGYTLIRIGDGAFAECTTLTTLRTGETLTSIGNEAFYGCSALATVEIGSNVTSVGYYAFEKTPWLDAYDGDFVVVGDGVLIKYKGEDAVVTIPAGVRTTADAFFRNDTLVEVVLGPDMQSVGEYCFAYCSSLRLVRFNETLTEIGVGAFSYCESIQRIKVGGNVKIIGDSAFLYCISLRYAELGDSVEEIGADAFNYCCLMTGIRLGRGLRRIGELAFFDCYVLRGVSYAGTQEEWTQIDFAAGNSFLTDAALRCAG